MSRRDSLPYSAVSALLAPIERWCVRRGVSPSALTLGSLGLCAMAGGLAAARKAGPAGIIYLAAGACDLLDGRVARATRTASPRGAALDSIADRVGESLVLGGVAWGARRGVTSAFAFAFLASSMVVSYARARGEGLGVSVGSGVMARGPRVVGLAVLLIAEGVRKRDRRLRGQRRVGERLVRWAQREPGPGRMFTLGVGLLGLTTCATALARTLHVLRLLPGPPLSVQGSRQPGAPHPLTARTKCAGSAEGLRIA